MNGSINVSETVAQKKVDPIQLQPNRLTSRSAGCLWPNSQWEARL